MDGLLVIDKPVGPTSHDVVARVRRILGEQRVGHTGTLDPGASGVLPLVVGRATRLARFLSAAGKSYDARSSSASRPTRGDSAGTPVGRAFEGPFPERESIDRALDAFRGTFLQQPPAYSAKKIGGKRSHRLARAALAHALPAAPPCPARAVLPRERHGPCAGAWPRRRRPSSRSVSIARPVSMCAGSRTIWDERLGVGGHLAALKRVRSGDLTLADATVLAALELDPPAALAALVPLAQMLPALTALTLTHEGARRAAHGLDLGPADFDGRVRRMRCFRRRCAAVPSARRRGRASSGSPSRSKGPGFCTPRSCWCNILSLFD